jgi:hypothetical protein
MFDSAMRFGRKIVLHPAIPFVEHVSTKEKRGS